MILDNRDSQRRHGAGRRPDRARPCEEAQIPGQATVFFLSIFSILVAAPGKRSISLPVAGFHRVS